MNKSILRNYKVRVLSKKNIYINYIFNLEFATDIFFFLL